MSPDGWWSTNGNGWASDSPVEGLDAFVIMPNRLCGIIVLTPEPAVGTGLAPTPNASAADMSTAKAPAPDASNRAPTRRPDAGEYGECVHIVDRGVVCARCQAAWLAAHPRARMATQSLRSHHL